MFEPGNVLLGKYRIDQIIGKGGMGVVARAHHLQLDVPVAIKFLHRNVLDRQHMVQRFLREAQAAVKLKSEHVSRIIDVGTLEDATPYIVMEYLRGADLGHLLRARGPLAPALAVDLVMQACEALAEAHALGIVHRDIKPSNLFLTQGPDGAPLLKVVDFGVSKAPTSLEEDITHSSAIMGTPVYMSPEQMQSSKHVDGRTDIWALGVVLYQLVSGRLPFRAESFAGLVMALATQRMRPLDDVTLPAGLGDVIARCIERDLALRFQTTAELAAALEPYASAPEDASRWTARTLRVLANPPEPVDLLADLQSGESLEMQVRGLTASAGPPVSTMGQSMGEQLVSGNTAPTRPMKPGLASASTAPATPAPAAPAAPARRGRRLAVGAAGLGLLGVTLAIASVIRGTGGTSEPVPAQADTKSDTLSGKLSGTPASDPDVRPAAAPGGTPEVTAEVTPDAGLPAAPAEAADHAAADPSAPDDPGTAGADSASGAAPAPRAGTVRPADARRRGSRKDERPRPKDEPDTNKDKDKIDGVFDTRQ